MGQATCAAQRRRNLDIDNKYESNEVDTETDVVDWERGALREVYLYTVKRDEKEHDLRDVGWRTGNGTGDLTCGIRVAQSVKRARAETACSLSETQVMNHEVIYDVLVCGYMRPKSRAE